MSLATVITGVGLVTPLGLGVDATWHALLAGRYITNTGVVPLDRDDQDRVSQLGIAAAREAIGECDRADLPLFVGTSKGPADAWLEPPRRIRPIGLHTLAEDLVTALKIAPRAQTLSAACASGLHALARACLHLDECRSRRVLVVAAESSLHPLWHGTFRNLGVLPPPGEPCRPFDTDRSGFVISEAAAAVVLERREPRSGELVIKSARIGSDATHLTGSDPEARTLRHLLSDVAGNVDFVHAHATATGSDAIELAAIEATLAGRPIVYSHKGSLGHTLGASGMVALAISSQAHALGIVPPHPTLRTAIPTALPLAGSQPGRRSIIRSILLASGFGGATALATLRTA